MSRKPTLSNYCERNNDIDSKIVFLEPKMDSSGFEPEASGALDVSQELMNSVLTFARPALYQIELRARKK